MCCARALRVCVLLCASLKRAFSLSYNTPKLLIQKLFLFLFFLIFFFFEKKKKKKKFQISILFFWGEEEEKKKGGKKKEEEKKSKIFLSSFREKRFCVFCCALHH